MVLIKDDIKRHCRVEVPVDVVMAACSPSDLMDGVIETSLKPVFNQIRADGEYVHCIEKEDLGVQDGNFRVNLQVFISSGQCLHDSIDECAKAFARGSWELWQETQPELKAKIQVIDRYDRNITILRYLAEMSRTGLPDEDRVDTLAEHIKWMVKLYPDHYGVKQL